jgi:hypothetical protein
VDGEGKCQLIGEVNVGMDALCVALKIFDKVNIQPCHQGGSRLPILNEVYADQNI